MNVLVPSNSTVLQVIFFAGLIGFAFVKLGEKTASLRKLVGEASETMIQVTRFVLEFTPLGTFGLIAALVGGYGFEKLLPLGSFVLALYAGLRVPHRGGVRRPAAGARAEPAEVLPRRGAGDAGGVRRLVELRGAAGVAAQRDPQPRRRPRLRRVRGAAGRQHQDGRLRRDLSRRWRRCSSPSTSGIELSLSQYLIIVLASVLGSFGTAGVPGTAVIMATVVLSAAGLPLEAIGYLYAIDRVLDMMRTMTNVTGQMLVPVLVAKETGCSTQASTTPRRRTSGCRKARSQARTGMSAGRYAHPSRG